MPLLITDIDHPHAEELRRISEILDSIPTISDMVWQDLTRDAKSPTGACGMTAEQVLRAAIIKTMRGFTYEELAFHLMDSRYYRHFCRIGVTHEGFAKSTLHGAIKTLSAETWEAINRLLMAYGESEEIEKGREVRIDCTVVDAPIHHPTDSSLLWDAVRSMTRLLQQLREQTEGVRISFKDHTRCAKRRMLGIYNAKNNTVRRKVYRDLLRVTERVLGYARGALRILERACCLFPAKPVEALKKLMALTGKVIDQATRRVIHGESVPSGEKVVSLFEPHTDIIVKDHRVTYYGHKVCLTVGRSYLVTDCLITRGNPADTSLVGDMIERQDKVFGRYPLKVALDGGFASKDNLKVAKGAGIKELCFGKKRGLKVEDMCRSEWVYKRLRRFRAGVESAISWLKRCFGLGRCTWKSLASFHSYVWSSIVTANLLTLARSAPD
jgi:IS5 family transposase